MSILSKAFNVAEYSVLRGSIADILNSDYVSPHALETQIVSVEMFPAIDEARPGYSKSAKAYLDSGHQGLAITTNGRIASMAWYFHNRSGHAKKIKGYVPVEPDEIHFHADWTSPAHRGKGHQRALILERAVRVNTSLGRSDLKTTTTIEPSNATSLRNYQLFGFKSDHRLTSLSIGPIFFNRILPL